MHSSSRAAKTPSAKGRMDSFWAFRTTVPLSAILCLVAAASAAGADPRIPLVATQAPPRNEVERFKTLVGARNIAEFELTWRKYIEGLYDREFRTDGPKPGPAAQVRPLAVDGNEGADWPFDRLYLGDKKVLHGMIRGEDAESIDFFEVRRAAGQGMSMQVRQVKLAEIARREELPPHERTRLWGLIQQHLNRRHVDRLDKKKLQFGERQDDFKRTLKTYRGAGFELESTAADETVRNCVVRIDQRMQAYRRLLPPHTEPRRPLKILLLGSALEYKTYLAQVRLEVAGPAFYSPETNQVVAYSERDVVMKKFDEARDSNKGLEQNLHKRKAELQKHLKQESDEFRQLGARPEEIRRLNQQRTAELVREINQIERDIDESDRKNQKSLDDYLEQSYRVLYHETFHAYLETYLYGQQQVPRWLNEGLAQVVENGRIESGQLRIDAPDRERLKRLYEDLHRPDALTLVGLFQAPPQAFLGIHASRKGDKSEAIEADRFYLYSWGLAYYLAFEKRVVGTKALDAYLAAENPPAATATLPGSIAGEDER